MPNNGTQFVVAWSPVSDPFNPDRQALDDHIKEESWAREWRLSTAARARQPAVQ